MESIRIDVENAGMWAVGVAAAVALAAFLRRVFFAGWYWRKMLSDMEALESRVKQLENKRRNGK